MKKTKQENISEVNTYKATVNVDSRGDLIAFDFSNCPFIPQRIFTLKNIPQNTSRGGHAHYKTDQFLICAQGQVRVFLNDGHSNKDQVYTLQENDTLFIPRMIWDRQVYKTKKDVLIVLASTQYDPKDYINDLGEFQKIIREQNS